MDPLTLALIMGGTGALKGLTADKEKEKRDIELQAATARYSPWTGLRPREVQYADPLGQAMQFGMTGAMLGQNSQRLAQPGNNWSAQRDAMKGPDLYFMDENGMQSAKLPRLY